MPQNKEIVATLLYPQNGIQAQIDKVYLYNPEAGGVKVLTDETLKGNGTSAEPLGLSDEIKEQIENAGKVDDVLVDGESVVENKIASIDLTGKVDKTSEADKIYGTDSLGTQTLYDKDAFGKVDDVRVNGASVVVNKIADVTVPTKVSDLANDANYQNATQVDTAIATATANMVEKGDNVSDLTNDADYQSGTEVDTAVSTAISTHNTSNDAHSNIITPIKADITDIQALIPTQATAQNQLADKDFVNSSVGTNTGYYISNNGQPFNSLAELEAYTGPVTNNDYAFVISTDQAGNTVYNRYKYNSDTQQWAFEYALNNSSFTANQWAAINSNATAEKIAKIDTTETALNTHISDKNNPHEVTKSQIGLGNVDNTSDLDKPISTATQTALDGKVSNTNRINGASLSNTASNFYGVSTSAATDIEKSVSIPSITTLDVGTVIFVQPTITSTVANSTLKLNDFAAYQMRYNNAAITTSTDSVVWNLNYVSMFLFDGTYWQFAGHGLDSNTTYTINYTVDAGRYKAGIGTYAVTRYSLLMEKADGTWEKITATTANYSTGTSKAVNTRGFRLNHIRYYNTTAAVANGALIATNTLQNKAASVNFAYSANCGTAPGWAVGDYIYLVGNIGADGLFYLDTTQWWSNALPNTNDGKLYVRLGIALTATDATMSFFDDRPVFYHNGTKICEYKVADNKQDMLVSGANIKTINGESILGSGDMAVVQIKELPATAELNTIYQYVGEDDRVKFDVVTATVAEKTSDNMNPRISDSAGFIEFIENINSTQDIECRQIKFEVTSNSSGLVYNFYIGDQYGHYYLYAENITTPYNGISIDAYGSVPVGSYLTYDIVYDEEWHYSGEFYKYIFASVIVGEKPSTMFITITDEDSVKNVFAMAEEMLSISVDKFRFELTNTDQRLFDIYAVEPDGTEHFVANVSGSEISSAGVQLIQTGSWSVGMSFTIDKVYSWSLIQKLAHLADVELTGVSDGQVLVYDSASDKWVNDDQHSGMSATYDEPTETITFA